MSSADSRRSTPRVDAVMRHPAVVERSRHLGIHMVKAIARDAISECRRGLIQSEEVVNSVVERLPPTATTMRPVINATGVVVHTNLGRAPLSQAAQDALARAAGTTDVEMDLQTGKRGKRGAAAIAALLSRVPNAEDAHVVNNGAAALALAASALAPAKEVIIARGELVEIGDGFRVPELLESVGARLREVGTTNRVRHKDYEGAISAETGFILKVHPSNYIVSGFTSVVAADQLATLTPPLVIDIGSGLLEPHPRLPNEPDAASMLAAGADLVVASGDKLLGGPQCGLVLGRHELVQRLRRHPLARALRIDKLRLAALEATLIGPPSPVQKSLGVRREELERRAVAIRGEVRRSEAFEIVRTSAAVGGGGAPGVELPSIALAIPPSLEKVLRTDSESPVVGRLHEDRLLLDLIAVDPDDDWRIVDVLNRHLPGRSD